MPLMINGLQNVRPFHRRHPRRVENRRGHCFGVADEGGEELAILLENGHTVRRSEMAEVGQPDPEEAAEFGVALGAGAHQYEKTLPAARRDAISLSASAVSRVAAPHGDEAALLESAQQWVKGAPAQTPMRSQRRIDDCLKQIAVHRAVHQLSQDKQLVHPCH